MPQLRDSNIRVAIYTRLSPNPDKEDTTNQEIALVEFANRHGWEIVDTYTDIHISGSKKGNDRIAFKRMMEDANRRKFDLLLFWSLDRLSREGALETLQYLSQLNSYGVNYKSYTEQYLDSMGVFKEAIISIMAVMAKQERIRLVERVNAGMLNAKQNGTKSGKAIGRPRVVIDRVKAKEMRDEGKSVVEIAKAYRTSIWTVYRALEPREGEEVRKLVPERLA